MPKLIDYPRASFKACIELAKAVESLGGKCSIDSAAQKLGKKVTGSFKSTIGAAGKFGLLISAGGNLTVTPLQKSIKLAYNEEEKNSILREAFLGPTVFRDLAQRFDGNTLPIEMLGKLLAREFGVDAATATTVANYFIDGAKSVGLLDGTGTVRLNNSEPEKATTTDEEVIHTREVVPIEVISSSDVSSRYEGGNKRRNESEDTHTSFTSVEITNNERRKIQIPLPQKRMAELIVPDEMTLKDLEIIKAQLEVLKVWVENS
jgi:hypothetical protein